MNNKITKDFLKHVLDQYEKAYNDIKTLSYLGAIQIALTNHDVDYGICNWVRTNNKYFYPDFYHFCSDKNIHNEALAPYPKRATNKTQILKCLKVRINWLKEQIS